MLLADFQPRPALVVKTTQVITPRFPVIDAHNHLGEPFGGGWDRRPLAELLERLDSTDVRHYVDLDGGWGEAILQQHLDLFKAKAPARFRIFGGVDWAQWPAQGAGFGEWAARRLEQQKAWGAEGLKIWKPFGLHVTGEKGERAAIDDARLDPIWEAAAALHWPVLIHIADPVAFFDPLDNHNERWEELQGHPDWHFPSPPFPPFLQLMDEFANLVARHPHTVFIGAHVGCYAENLQWVGELLDGCNPLRAWWHVALPLSRTALVAFGVLVVMWSWNDFLWPLIITNRTEMQMLSVGIAYFQGQFISNFAVMMAAATVATLPMVLVFLLAQRQLLEGITLSGLKG